MRKDVLLYACETRMKLKGAMTSPADNQGNAEYPYAQREVYEALVAAIKGMRTMRLVSVDESRGRVVVKPVGSALSWSRNMLISVVATPAGTSKVSADSPPRANPVLGGAFDTGQYRRNIDAIIDATSSELGRHPPIHASPHSAASARIAELQSLLGRGFISRVEFDKWSAEIRGNE